MITVRVPAININELTSFADEWGNLTEWINENRLNSIRVAVPEKYIHVITMTTTTIYKKLETKMYVLN
ncbi:hypothetical protein ORD22_11140 [Sporosarcina sp. GW1-11]|uniref:hypothetical protein n=1 Tax=Sporosarcina sp. GW1-11 TaxID=2899126 RepID=UPI00294D6B62|nr:hypothetical protein [Sporosarcina sp. GW1-11]MDV6378770.1 hypothetical protein [Sporosarcina sp. GW1-11]